MSRSCGEGWICPRRCAGRRRRKDDGRPWSLCCCPETGGSPELGHVWGRRLSWRLGKLLW